MASIDFLRNRVPVPEWAARWWKFDQDFSAKVMAGDWTNMRKEDLIYGATQGILAVAIATAACGLAETSPNNTQPSIGLINEAIAAGYPASLKKLDAVKTRSGIPCIPQLINVKSSKGSEELGICRVTNNGVEGSVIVSRESASGTETINKPLVGYRQSDGRLIVGYQRSDIPTDVGQVMIFYSDGSSEYIYGNGLRIMFDKQQTTQANLLENFIGKLIEPGGVAAAAEIDTPTATATVALMPTPKPIETLVFPTPTEKPTLVPTKTPGPINTEVYTPTDVSVLPKCEEAAGETIKWITEYVANNPDKDFSPEIESTYSYFGTNAWSKSVYAHVGGLVKVAIGGEFNGVNQGKIDIGDGSYTQCVVFFYKDAAGKLVIDYAAAGQKINGQWYGPLVGSTIMVESEFVTLVENKLGKRLHMQGAVVSVPDSFRPNFPVDPNKEPWRAMKYDLEIYLAQQQSDQVKKVIDNMSGIGVESGGGFMVLPSVFDFGY